MYSLFYVALLVLDLLYEKTPETKEDMNKRKYKNITVWSLLTGDLNAWLFWKLSAGWINVPGF
jgi:hypothetical protein